MPLVQTSLVIGIFGVSTYGPQLNVALTVNGTERPETLASMSGVRFVNNVGIFAGTLPGGAHMLKVQYLTTEESVVFPSSGDWQSAALDVVSVGAEPHCAVPVVRTDHTLTNLQATLLSSADAWSEWPGLSASIDLERREVILAAYQVSTLASDSHVVSRLLINGTEQPQTRSISGDMSHLTTSGVFLGSLPQGTHELTAMYRTPAQDISFPCGGGDSLVRALSFAVLPGAQILHSSVDSSSFSLDGADSWTDWPSLSTTIDLGEDAVVLAVYQTASEGARLLASQLYVGGAAQPQTRSLIGSTNFASTVGLFVGRLTKGIHEFTVKYLISEERSVAVGDPDFYTRALSVVALDGALHLAAEPPLTQFLLRGSNTWLVFPGLTKDVECMERCLILASYQTALSGRSSGVFSGHLSTKMFIDGVEQEQTRSSSGSAAYVSNFGLFVGKLQRGNHTFEVKYRTAGLDFEFPENGGDRHTLSLNVVHVQWLSPTQTWSTWH